MNFISLASSIDVDQLADDSSISTFALLLVFPLIILSMLSALAAFSVVINKNWTAWRKAFVSVVALASIAGAIGSNALMNSQQPDADKVVTKAFAAEYPDLTLYADDLDCIDSLLHPSADGPAKTCPATRKADGGYAKVEYAKYRGKFVVTSPSGAEVRSDADIQVFEGSR